jgi:hypothetical protein
MYLFTPTDRIADLAVDFDRFRLVSRQHPI